MFALSKMIGLVLAGICFFAAPAIADSTTASETERARLAGDLEKFVKDIPGVRIHTIGNAVFLDGEVASWESLYRLQDVSETLHHAEASKGIEVHDMVRLSSEGKEAVARKIEHEIGSPEIKVHFVKDTLFIEGTADNEFGADRAVMVTKAYLMTPSTSKNMGPASNEKTDAFSSRVPAAMPPSFFIVDMITVRPPGKPFSKMSK